MEQGDLALLDHPVARRLLASTEFARLAYLAQDGTPRLIPMLFHWNGRELVLPTFAMSRKLRSLRHNPQVAVTIDRPGPPPEMLMLRGSAEVGVEPGVVEEYDLAQRRYYGDEAGAATARATADSGASMARIVLRPSWVGVVDFQTRFPAGLVAAGLAPAPAS
jgi:PPOX class probable F420-dependent enzyme